MEILVVLCIIAGVHCMIYFFDQFFKSCAHYPYIQFLNGTGFKISFLRIKWSTYALNRSFMRWGCSYNRFYDRWFAIGRYISLLMVPISIFLLLYSIFQNHSPSYPATNSTRNHLKIEAVLPGVNMPANDLSYYIFTLIFCSIVHELGHALAAVREDINVLNVGVNLYFVLPIAYVNLPADKLATLKPWRTLKILCAGIWHNIVLTAIAYVIYTSIPYVYSMGFHVNEGMFVKDIASNSPLLGQKGHPIEIGTFKLLKYLLNNSELNAYEGIQVGDVISSINHCKVASINDYYHCLIVSQTKTDLGYCLEQDVLKSIQNDIVESSFKNSDCCRGEVVPGHLCFRYDVAKEACLPARAILTAATMTCTHQSNCTSPYPHCLCPTSLQPPTRLLKIILSNSKKPPIIYIGLPYDLYHTLTVSQYTPKHPLSALLMPDQFMRTLQYLAMISFGLAIVNSLPCLQMDGQHILGSVLRLIAGSRWTLERVQQITVTTCFIGTIVLVWHSGWSLYTTIFVSS